MTEKWLDLISEVVLKNMNIITDLRTQTEIERLSRKGLIERKRLFSLENKLEKISQKFMQALNIKSHKTKESYGKALHLKTYYSPFSNQMAR